MQILNVLPHAAAAELLKRRRARADLLSFATYIHPEYDATMGWHHRELAVALQDVEAGCCRRLIISMPPRHGKSEFASVLFPCWALGRNPRLRIVQSGYSADMALTHSRHARDVFVSPEFGRLFPGMLHCPGREAQRQVEVLRQAASEWGTMLGGSYYAVGVGGGLTGREFDIGLIDDPVKDREAANSPRIQERTEDWYRSTFYTRQSPDAAIIVIMTRWHPDDLAGTRIREMEAGGEQWRVIRFPAVRDDPDGYDALWPERFPAKTLTAVRAAVGRYEWEALYQQQPTIRGGNRFQVVVGVNVHIHDSLSAFPSGRYVRGWDLASSEKQRAGDDPDWTFGIKGLVQTRAQRFNGIAACEHHIWVADAAYCREEAPKRDAMIRATVARDGAGVAQHVEAFGGYKDAYTSLKAALAGASVVRKSHLSGDKSAKLAPLEPAFESGHVHLLRAPWNDVWLKQFAEFPNGRHDDACDATAVMFHAQVAADAPGIANPYLLSRAGLL